MSTSLQQVEVLFDNEDYNKLLSELEKYREMFIDELYPTYIHDIVWQIDLFNQSYMKNDYQSMELIINNLLGKEQGKLRLNKKVNLISLRDAF